MSDESDAAKVIDAIRNEYRELSVDEREAVASVKALGAVLIASFEGLGQSRELSIAKTKIEEAVMWAVKHVTA